MTTQPPLEQRIRNGIARLEKAILHHIQERDGWRPDDGCYQDLVATVVADLVALVVEAEWLGRCEELEKAIRTLQACSMTSPRRR
jgi:hypothetical protein